MTSDADKWNARYSAQKDGVALPARVLRENLPLLSGHGCALDLAAGLGGNALLLAQRGFETHAWDISEVAVERLRQESARHGLSIHCQTRDVVAHPPAATSFDLIVVSRILERALCPALVQALKPGGLLCYQTWTIDSSEGPGNPAYRLQRNELLHLFAGLQVVFYREEGIVAPSAGEAMLIARRG